MFDETEDGRTLQDKGMYMKFITEFQVVHDAPVSISSSLQTALNITYTVNRTDTFRHEANRSLLLAPLTLPT